jgi:murein DD-endopeptidase MepM/ murein hydrolase activator NlpD
MGKSGAELMKRFILFSFGAGLLLVALVLGSPVRKTAAAPLAPGLSVQVMPRILRPANAGMVVIDGGYPLNVTVTLSNEPLEVYWTGKNYLAVFSFGFDASPGSYQIAIRVEDPASGARIVENETVTVSDYAYPHETISLPSRLIPLLGTDLNVNEQKQLEAIYALRTQPVKWSWPFGLPVLNGAITSQFGGDRAYNGGMWYQYHTGVDFRGEVGDPILASSAGQVVTARHFDVRGNVVILDHGYGVFSEYAHLSEIVVQPGQIVQRGQLLALAGATGRTNGPHLHFEIIVNGQPVDPIHWLALSPAFVAPPEVPARQPAEPVVPEPSADVGPTPETGTDG